MSWVSENAGGQTHPVKQASPNAWGLFDMHGNVLEWVGDGLRAYDPENTVDPLGPPPTTTGCARGGCWEWGWGAARSATRTARDRGARGPSEGFRIAASVSRDTASWTQAASGVPVLDRLATPPDDGVFLGDLKPLRVSTDYAPAVNEAWGARSCLVGGRTCTTFVTVHAPSEVVWPIPAQASEFTAIGARGDRPETFHGTWKYRILVDEKTVFESTPFHERRTGIAIEVKIPRGAKRLTVVTDPLGDHRHDWALLAWPYIRVPSRLEVLARIPDGAHRFTAIGSRWDREPAAHGTWKYEVWIDGTRVLDSPALHEPEGILIDVAIPPGARELRIVVDDFGDKDCDWSILAYPCFHLTEAADAVARRVGLRPNEAAFRTSDGGGWLPRAAASPGWSSPTTRRILPRASAGSGSINPSACSCSGPPTEGACASRPACRSSRTLPWIRRRST